MKKHIQDVAVSVHLPKICERYSARVRTECPCGTVMVATLERSISGIVSPSISTICPNCQTDHHQMIAVVAGMIDAAKDANERLAILN